MPRTAAGPPSGNSPRDQAVATPTRITIGASLRPDSPSRTDRTRAGSGSPRSTENTAAESVGAVTAPMRTAVGKSKPRTPTQNEATRAMDTATPSVASSPAIVSDPRMSTQRVVKPPSPRMNTSAAKPSACASEASVIGKPTSASTRPSPRNSSSEGSPSAAPTRADIAANRSTTAPMSSSMSTVIGRPPRA